MPADTEQLQSLEPRRSEEDKRSATSEKGDAAPDEAKGGMGGYVVGISNTLRYQ